MPSVIAYVLDDIVDLIEEYWYVVLIAAVVVTGGYAIHAGWVDSDEILDIVTGQVNVEIECDEGVCFPYGEGRYDKNSKVLVDANVIVGWFFEGWYDSDGNQLSPDREFEFRASKSCKLFAKSSRGYGVTLYKTAGIAEVYGGGSYQSDADGTASASVLPGCRFTGWYDLEGNLVSSQQTMALTSHEDVVLFARTDSENGFAGENKVEFESREDFPGKDSFMVVRDDRTDEVAAWSVGSQGWEAGLAPGQYYLTTRGTGADGMYRLEMKTFIVDGTSSNVYRWSFKGTQYTLTWDLDMDVYEKYIARDAGRWPISARYTSFVDYGSENVKAVAEKLASLSVSMSETDRADFVLKFVQLCTEYERDFRYEHTTGVEHWKYPVETLFEGRGDCEDTSILYCALMKAMGYDVALLIYSGAQYKDNGHAAASVALDYVKDGTYYEKDGLRFYYCETTSDKMVVGEIWDDYDRGQVLVIP
ncbi:MAG: hypothetical protein J6Z16_00615 [Candidatus Methanomethylophilaceae archaeon]|nr:hypothetical protein [Candidatus Methanomethylophilaceae archaeon]